MNQEKNNKEISEWIFCIIIALIIALLFRYFIGSPTIVQGESMKSTLIEKERLWLNRWTRTTKTLPQRGQIITFEEPSKINYIENGDDINLKNPIAQYDQKNVYQWFINNFLEIGKRSYIKRVIALPGEHVEIKHGKVYINDKQLDEPYLQPGVVTDINENSKLNDFKVPENCVFAMGDNRTQSTDCRAFGCVPLDKIESVVSIRIWPLNKFGRID